MEKQKKTRESTFKTLSSFNDSSPLEVEIRKIFKSFNEKKMFRMKTNTVLKFKNNISFGTYFGDMDLKINPDAYTVGNVAVLQGHEVQAFIYYSLISNNGGDRTGENTGLTIHFENCSTLNTEYFGVLTMLLVLAAKNNGSRVTMSKNLICMKNKGNLSFARNKLDNDVAFEFSGSKRDAVKILKTLLSDTKNHNYHNDFNRTVIGMVNVFNREFEACDKSGSGKRISSYRPKFEFLNKFDVKSINGLRESNYSCSKYIGPAFGICTKDITNSKITSYLLFNEEEITRGVKGIRVDGGCVDGFYKGQKLGFFLGLLLLASAAQYNKDYTSGDKIQFVISNYNLPSECRRNFINELNFKVNHSKKKYIDFSKMDWKDIQDKVARGKPLRVDERADVFSTIGMPIELFYSFNKKDTNEVFKLVKRTLDNICDFWGE